MTRGTTQFASEDAPSGSIKPFALTRRNGKRLLTQRLCVRAFGSEVIGLQVHPLPARSFRRLSEAPGQEHNSVIAFLIRTAKIVAQLLQKRQVFFRIRIKLCKNCPIPPQGP